MFNRKQTVQDLGDFLYRYHVRYESVECEPFSFAGLTIQQNMLSSIVESPEMLNCGKGRFQQFRMFHNGLCWIIELQRDENENRGILSGQQKTQQQTPGST